MAEGGIFLTIGGELTVLEQQAYDSEAVLQQALEDFPAVIAGPTTAGVGSGRLLLVRREMGVPATPGGGAMWSVDHLFLDAEGVPVVVEVKRASDTRICREVVGQMLDYAANGVVYWPVEALRAARSRATISLAPCWAATTSRSFGNLGVELRQYVGGGHTVYVPQVTGRTEAAASVKGPGPAGQQWTEDSFLAAAKERRPAAELKLIRRLLDDVNTRSSGLYPKWGKSATPGVSGWYTVGGQPTAVWNLLVGGEAPGARGYLYFYLGDIAKRLPGERLERAAQILERIPSLSKIAEARAHQWNKYPSAYLDELAASDDAIAAVFAAIDDLTAPA